MSLPNCWAMFKKVNILILRHAAETQLHFTGADTWSVGQRSKLFINPWCNWLCIRSDGERMGISHGLQCFEWNSISMRLSLIENMIVALGMPKCKMNILIQPGLCDPMSEPIKLNFSARRGRKDNTHSWIHFWFLKLVEESGLCDICNFSKHILSTCICLFQFITILLWTLFIHSEVKSGAYMFEKP